MLDSLFYDENELPNLKIYETAQTVIKDYMDKKHRSIEFVAEQLGTTKGYLYPILNPKRTDKPLSMDRAIEITKLTDDYRIIEALNSEFNRIAICKDSYENVTNKDLKEMLIQVNIECSDVFREGMEAIADGVITRTERIKVLKEIEEEQTKMEELRQAVLNCEVEE